MLLIFKWNYCFEATVWQSSIVPCRLMSMSKKINNCISDWREHRPCQSTCTAGLWSQRRTGNWVWPWGSSPTGRAYWQKPSAVSVFEWWPHSCTLLLHPEPQSPRPTGKAFAPPVKIRGNGHELNDNFNTDAEYLSLSNLISRVISDLRWEQVTLPQLIIQLNSLLKQWIFLLAQVGDLLADLFGVLSAATAKEAVPLAQLSLKRLNSPAKCHQVLTKGLVGRWIQTFSICKFPEPLTVWGFAFINTWLERSRLISSPLRSCSRASFLARIVSRLVSSPSRSSSPLLWSRTRSISSSSQRFCSSIFCSLAINTEKMNQKNEACCYASVAIRIIHSADQAFVWH